jgi:hypothetical protein
MHWNTAQLELRNLLVPSLRLAEGHRTQAQTPANRLPVTTGSLGHAAEFVLHIVHFIPWWKLNCNPDSVFATDYARDAQPPLSEEGSGIRVKSPK